jgi:putative Ca2+/H+ antiporter (TMEM165/GDT1 family)
MAPRENSKDGTAFAREVFLREFLIMFVTIFLAELGDKTQLATLLFASERKLPAAAVFGASAGALVLGAALTVVLGTVAARFLVHVPVKLIAGLGFIAIGVFTTADYFRG